MSDLASWCGVCTTWRYLGAPLLADVAVAVMRSDREDMARDILSSDIPYRHLRLQVGDVLPAYCALTYLTGT